jgi:hypothetical protein
MIERPGNAQQAHSAVLNSPAMDALRRPYLYGSPGCNGDLAVTGRLNLTAVEKPRLSAPSVVIPENHYRAKENSWH